MAQNDCIYDNFTVCPSSLPLNLCSREQVYLMTSRRTINLTCFELCINIEAKARTSYDHFLSKTL